MKTMVNTKDTSGFIWDVVFVFDGFIPSWGEKLIEEGHWVPMSWDGFDNAIGYSHSIAIKGSDT